MMSENNTITENKVRNVSNEEGAVSLAHNYIPSTSYDSNSVIMDQNLATCI